MTYLRAKKYVAFLAKCYKKFQSNGAGNVDYSGYNRDTWQKRDCDSHRHNCQQVMKETTKTGIRKKESELGARYSILLSLPYFNLVRFTVVDIMHNLFLGTGKHMFRTWLKLVILSMNDLKEIEEVQKV